MNWIDILMDRQLLTSTVDLVDEEQLNVAFELLHPKGWDLVLEENNYQNSHMNKKKKIVVMTVNKDRKVSLPIYLHELGHAYMGREKGSANWKLDNLKPGQVFDSSLIYDSEVEAWIKARELARKLGITKWGIRTELGVKVALKSYARMVKMHPKSKYEPD